MLCAAQRPQSLLTAAWALSLLLDLAVNPAAAAAKPLSVLLITVDDLRPEIGAFHPWSANDTIVTPHLDSLAASGTLFTNAVCNFALCAPSRTSFLTSLRPDTTKVWSIGPFFRNLTERGAAAVTLPQAFKNAGYHTESLGKVFHVSAECYGHPIVTGGKKGCLNDPISWSIPAWLPDPYAERGNSTTSKGRNPSGPMNPELLSWVAFDAPDDEFPDGVRRIPSLAWAGGISHTSSRLQAISPHMQYWHCSESRRRWWITAKVSSWVWDF
jgi:hypothetical protein